MHSTTRIVVYLAVGFLVGLFSTSCHANEAPRLSDYVGKWVVKSAGRNFLVLTLKLEGDQLSGSMVLPEHFEVDQDGDVSHVSPEHSERPVVHASLVDGRLELITQHGEDKDRFAMVLTDHNNATLQLVDAAIAPWRLQRVAESEETTVATSWPELKAASPEIAALQATLKEMVIEDQAVRTVKPISAQQLKQVDEKHYAEIKRIHQRYGWPRISLVGKEAAHDYWLLVQHQKLEFQQQVLPEMERAVKEGEASRVDLTYLYDRVMVREGKPQHWGTQTSCQQGRAVLDPVDDPAGLEKRRKELRLMPIDEYLKSLDSQCSIFVQDNPDSSRP